jgi:hypothetical protein
MTRHLIIFAACFLLGAVMTAAIRTSRHQPYDDRRGPPAGAPASTVEHYPNGRGAASAAATTPPVTAPTTAVPVNTVCPICAMPVNPTLPTATYQGSVIGFGCKACPPKFAADPERYGPAALANQVVEE